jgi:hypothetical protein
MTKTFRIAAMLGNAGILAFFGYTLIEKGMPSAREFRIVLGLSMTVITSLFALAQPVIPLISGKDSLLMLDFEARKAKLRIQIADVEEKSVA